MHRYILAESAHACQESSETEFESNYHSDLDQSNFSHFAAVKLSILMIIYCLALTVCGVWQGFVMSNSLFAGVCSNSADSMSTVQSDL